METIFLILLSTLILGVNCVVVNLKNGAINGTTARTKEGRLFYKFLGIPYAKPPINELRFQPPVPIEPWSGIKDATEPPPICVQWVLYGDASSIGQEDCLYLNVYVPDGLLNSTGKAPVMVGIHGGAYQFGSSKDYAGDYFMERDVIFVAMNYRLGLLGFLAVNEILSLNSSTISGNFGLKDQSLALKWVNENIAQFGGDPANVTLVGESAGAASVHLHMFSPLSKGLFQKAIFESGNAFSPWARFPPKFKVNASGMQVRLDQFVAMSFLDKTNCTNQTSEKILKCVQSIPAEEFTKPDGLRTFLMYLPIIESGVSQAFLPHEPDVSTYHTRVPWITGINSGEGALIVPYLLKNGSYFAKEKNSNKTYSIPSLNFYLFSANQTDMNNITEAVDEYYFNNEDLGLETAHHLVDMITDSSWLYPLKKTVGGGPSLQYLYLYDHRGTFSLQDSKSLTIDLGVCHGDELPLLYRNEQLEAARTIQDRRVSDILLKFWINFAISGDPNRHSKEKIWTPVQTNGPEFNYLHINSTGEVVEQDMYADRYNLWRKLPTGW